ncbi:hypothetical protein AOT83_06565 [Mycobacteroides sp. H001]|uniref:hypothetical protein n=1 Tax=Mycobacteroides TaxID=670516 RepID=UPI000713011A|nr:MULTISPECIES: hypothetical protein [Mycobacteroides]KRQ20391.1 hypothetical protein AOT86_23610 [Mycobacteroides sp. H072]KRQ34264.1 hypothetical protein AOT84_18770 [Mycobacteroides sp. H002]KRQ52019.1 hypothetical protein AOT85_09300 [Mycobacteroides sp. H054]KRQ71291.1 hypothetical protein AOT83_06565 [Mycobacteroides sp. H001]OHU33044.1 hypothetical protein BKG79_23640 [Mycobacteroides chelonae]
MGTSADRSAGSGGAWTPLKYAAASYVRHLDGPNSEAHARRVLGRHVPLLGGAGGAATSARAGATGIQNLGALLSGIGAAGLAEALSTIGLADLIGRDRFTVLDELIGFIAGDGDDLDAQAARDAACDVLDEVFGDADQWDELADISIDETDLLALLQSFLALYVYNRVPVVAERLSRLSDPVAMRKADQEMRQIIANLVAIHLPEDPFAVDWRGEQGRGIADDAISSAYQAISALDDGDDS